MESKISLFLPSTSLLAHFHIAVPNLYPLLLALPVISYERDGPRCRMGRGDGQEDTVLCKVSVFFEALHVFLSPLMARGFLRVHSARANTISDAAGRFVGSSLLSFGPSLASGYNTLCEFRIGTSCLNRLFKSGGVGISGLPTMGQLSRRQHAGPDLGLVAKMFWCQTQRY